MKLYYDAIRDYADTDPRAAEVVRRAAQQTKRLKKQAKGRVERLNRRDEDRRERSI